MKPKIVLAGGTGFIGKYLQNQFEKEGYEVIIISRKFSSITWDNQQEIIGALNEAEMLINLAGKSVDCRYSESNKKLILHSRITTTKILGNAILQCKTPPKLWINSSTATIYRHAEDKPMTEETGEIGTGFSVDVAKAWEKAFFDFNLTTTRQVALRISIVLGKNGGALTPIVNLTKFYLGGKQGNGKQQFSWIHLEDLYRIIETVKNNEKIVGALNCASPTPVTNNQLMTSVRKALGKTFGLPIPKFLLELGAVLIQTETELILKSRWVLPDRLNKIGFQFKYPKLDDALKQILS